MTLERLKLLFSEKGCTKIYVKRLAPNDNSKNQVYLTGGSFEVLNIFPLAGIRYESPGEWEKERFKAAVDFYWLTEEGGLAAAPHSQFILYPKYPEIRFSGFLLRCANAPSDLMTRRQDGRLLFLAPTPDGKLLGYVAAPDSEVAVAFQNSGADETYGVFDVIVLPRALNSRAKLLRELYRIHLLEWIPSKRLNKEGEIIPCNAPQCGGYTLEAELGIRPNGYSEPDYLGWEVKNFSVSSLDNITSRVITLMTPEPTHGYYVTEGVKSFIRKYGYEDLHGRADRMNFGGVHKVGETHHRTGLKLELIGFDTASGKIKSADGRIALIDPTGNEAASWGFDSLLLHWNRKHHQACFVPSLSDTAGPRRYYYGDKVILGTGTDFQFFLQQMAAGEVFYDPGIKLENASGAGTTKRRSQFRIKSGALGKLYRKHEIVTLP